MVKLTGKQVERFWSLVKENENGCWVWTGAIERKYGRFFDGRRHKRAHRVAYEMVVGEIPEGLVLDHLCRNQACVRPAHLEPVTPYENVMRGVGPCAKNKAKTHCSRGHEYTFENTYVRTRNGRTHRRCRTCNGYRILRSVSGQSQAA